VINHPQENFFKIDNAITDAHFSVIDEKKLDIDFTKLNTPQLFLLWPDLKTKIVEMSFLDHRGLYV
jgi:hypothetical protein